MSIGTGQNVKEANGYTIAIESDGVTEAKNGKAMAFGTLMDNETGSIAPFVAFGDTAVAVVDRKVLPKQPRLAEPQDGKDRQVLMVSVWQDAKGNNILA